MGRLNAEDRRLICNLRTHKGWGSTRMIKEFPNKMWKRRAVDYLIKKIDRRYNSEEAGQRTSKICSNHRKRRDRKRAHL